MLRTDELINEFYPEFIPADDACYKLEEALKENGLVDKIHNCHATDDRISYLRRILWKAYQADEIVSDEAIPRAVTLIENALKVREEWSMDTLVNSNDAEFNAFFEEYRKRAPHITYGTTHEGQPIHYTRYGLFDLEWLEAHWETHETFMKKSELRILEYMTKHVSEKESEKRGKTVDRFVWVHDSTDVSLAHVSFFQTFLSPMAHVIRALYPEIICRVEIYNAPWWLVGSAEVLKLFLHPMSQKKVMINSEFPEWLPTVTAIADIPSFAGGECTAEYFTTSTPDIGGFRHGGEMLELIKKLPTYPEITQIHIPDDSTNEEEKSPTHPEITQIHIPDDSTNEADEN